MMKISQIIVFEVISTFETNDFMLINKNLLKKRLTLSAMTRDSVHER